MPVYGSAALNGRLWSSAWECCVGSRVFVVDWPKVTEKANTAYIICEVFMVVGDQINVFFFGLPHCSG
jgi:hypothetical protein